MELAGQIEPYGLPTSASARTLRAGVLSIVALLGHYQRFECSADVWYSCFVARSCPYQSPFRSPAHWYRHTRRTCHPKRRHQWVSRMCELELCICRGREFVDGSQGELQRLPSLWFVSTHLSDYLQRIALSSGSACTSASLEPSYVLRALGAAEDMAHSSLRFGIGRFTTEAEIDYAVSEIVSVVTRLRDMR